MANLNCVFIGGFANSEEACKEFGLALTKATNWDVVTFTFRDALVNAKVVQEYGQKADIVITHSASLFFTEEFKLRPKLLIAHAPPSNVRKRDFIYRFLARETKRLFVKEGAILGDHDLMLGEMLKLPQRISETDVEEVLGTQKKWAVLCPTDDPLFRLQDYPLEIINDPNFTVVEGGHNALFEDAEDVAKVIEEIAQQLGPKQSA